MLGKAGSFNLVRYEVGKDIQENFIEKFDLLIEAGYFVKMLVPTEHFKTSPNSHKIGLVIRSNLTGVRRQCYA